MPRSPTAALAARMERIKNLVDDLARASSGETSTTDALADRIKREVEAVGRALKRPKP
jgi:O6-methylguanine-DNA--protein-cysteine methyltransferase